MARFRKKSFKKGNRPRKRGQKKQSKYITIGRGGSIIM